MTPINACHTLLAIICFICFTQPCSSKRDELKSINRVELGKSTNELEKESAWKSWSSWSICSRTCDGGASFRYRDCRKGGQCSGEKMQYKLCNLQPCPPGGADFRAQQCAAYDKIPVKGHLHHWFPQVDAKKPCALHCRSKEEDFVKEMAPQALDGTRCRHGSLDMCINGQCMPVGCDLKLGSTAKLDACGICGGDGSQCGETTPFHWTESHFSSCSKSCGGGHETSSVVCKERASGAIVDNSNCDPNSRPTVRIRECNKHSCHSSAVTPPRSRPAVLMHPAHNQWTSDPWGPCTEDCNGGVQARRVYCMHIFPNSTKQPAADFHCTKHTQPLTSRRCNNFPCPQWHTSNWSECSATCGRGGQSRTVKCVDHKGYDSDACDKSRKPNDRRVCKAAAYCADADWNDKPEDRPHSEQALPLVAPPPQGNWETQMNLEEALKFEDTPMFAIGPWSECSATCGHGFRQRSIECKLYIKFSVKLVQLPDSECSDPRPVEREPCSKRPCVDGNSSMPVESEDDNDNDDDDNGDKAQDGVAVTYSWHYEGYTACTRTCLGGMRHAIIKCFRDHDQSAVEDKYCRNARKPAELKQGCNDVPCPPRWNTSDFSSCSQSCGGGSQTRTVQCVQELGSSPGDLLLMPPDACPYPPPRTQVLCSTTDCPAYWDVGQWSPCSVTCGSGLMERQVVCRQRLASGDTKDIVQSVAECTEAKPTAMKSCFLGECSGGENFDYRLTKIPPKAPVTLSVVRGKGRANKLKVGGSAVLYEGNDLRLKCPVLLVDNRRPPVTWLKDGKPIVYSKSFKGHIKMSQLGAVKIKSLRRTDAGTYTCISGPVKESIHLTVVGSKTPNSKATNIPRITSYDPLYMGKTKNTTQQKFYANSTDALRILQTVSQKTTPFSNSIAGSEEFDRVTPDRLKYYADQSTTPQEIYDKDIRHAVTVVLDMFGSDLAGEFQDFDNRVEGEESQRLEVRSKTGENLIVFEWITGDWSTCSKSCNGGQQVRTVECQVALNGRAQLAKNILCLNGGLTSPPVANRVCGLAECPEWQTGPWQECDLSECFSLHTAIQSRNVTCATTDGRVVEAETCPVDRPRDKRDCANQKCTAVWTTGPWSECTVTCGTGGIRSRILKCVWYGTDKPAGNMCRTLERPAIKESCDNLSACTKMESQCRDHFKYCDYANSLKLCRQKAYRTRCCRTCNAHQSQ